MTWIQTVRMDDDKSVKDAIESQRKLYPIEYATPVQPVNDGETAGIVASHTLIPEALYHAFSTFGALMSRTAVEAPPARDDRHHGVGHQPLSLLNRLPRRVSASRYAKGRDGGSAEEGLPHRAHQ